MTAGRDLKDFNALSQNKSVWVYLCPTSSKQAMFTPCSKPYSDVEQEKKILLEIVQFLF